MKGQKNDPYVTKCHLATTPHFVVLCGDEHPMRVIYGENGMPVQYSVHGHSIWCLVIDALEY